MYETESVAKIEAKDVGIGTLVWYKGYTSLDSWDCPAVMHAVNEARDEFQVTSLDDMRKQDQTYFVGRDPYNSYSQKHMRLASVAEVDAFLASKGSRKTAKQVIAQVQRAATLRGLLSV